MCHVKGSQGIAFSICCFRTYDVQLQHSDSEDTIFCVQLLVPLSLSVSLCEQASLSLAAHE